MTRTTPHHPLRSKGLEALYNVHVLIYNPMSFLTQLHDEFEFRAMLRMNENQYVSILDKVRPLIEKENTSFIALVDADYRFIYLDVGSEGRVADGGIWRRSSLYRWMKAGILNIPPSKPWPNGEEHGPQSNAIVADDAFALSTNLMKPYSTRSLTKTQRIFNYRLSRARRVAENAFGIMSNRFRILLTNVYRTPDRVVQMCLCVGALHNYLRATGGASYIGPAGVDLEDANHHTIPGEWRGDAPLQVLQTSQNRNATRDAKAMRDQMATYFSEGGGRVAWQDQAIELNN